MPPPIAACLSCSSRLLRPHCGPKAEPPTGGRCDLVRCLACRAYGTADGTRWCSPSGAEP